MAWQKKLIWKARYVLYKPVRSSNSWGLNIFVWDAFKMEIPFYWMNMNQVSTQTGKKMLSFIGLHTFCTVRRLAVTEVWIQKAYFRLARIREAPVSKKCSFLEHCSKGLCPPPPFYLNICPILQGVFFKTRFWAIKMVVIMYLFHHQSLKSPFSCKFHVVKWPPEHTTFTT